MQAWAPHKEDLIIFARSLLEGIPLTCIPQSLVVQCTAIRPRPVVYGGAAEIYEGQLNGRKVALKLYRGYVERMDGLRVRSSHAHTPTNFRSVSFQICREALLWHQLRHPNILPLLGIDSSHFLGKLCLVSPWVHHGNIGQYMQDPTNLESHLGRCVR